MIPTRAQLITTLTNYAHKHGGSVDISEYSVKVPDYNTEETTPPVAKELYLDEQHNAYIRLDSNTNDSHSLDELNNDVIEEIYYNIFN